MLSAPELAATIIVSGALLMGARAPNLYLHSYKHSFLQRTVCCAWSSLNISSAHRFHQQRLSSPTVNVFSSFAYSPASSHHIGWYLMWKLVLSRSGFVRAICGMEPLKQQ